VRRIYSWQPETLRQHIRAGNVQHEAINVCGWPVQFLPAESPLLQEAVEQAREIDFEGVPARVMTAEHLMVIALQTGRGKDFARLVSFTEAKVADAGRLHEILQRHGLTTAWQHFEQRYLNNP